MTVGRDGFAPLVRIVAVESALPESVTLQLSLAALRDEATASVEALGRYGSDRGSATFSAAGATTDRYLDPPVEENFTNHGATSSASGRIEQDVTRSDRLGVIVRFGRAHFLVPNERAQAAAGQRQDRESAETAVQASDQKIFSARLIGDIRGMLRDASAGLWSNAAATPILVSQDRGFRAVAPPRSVAVRLRADF